jgi:CRISPR/Cas system-associated protein Cas5 (RAMP superfamily)
VKRLKSVKPTVDNKAPKQFKHLKIKHSKSGKFRKREIDYQNKILLSKMMNILKRRNDKTDYNMAMPPMGSLNFLQRKKQIEKINVDNMVT